MPLKYPYLGFGLGLRSIHFPYIIEHKPKIDWFEIISENYMENEGKALANLQIIRQNYPMVMHGVSLSIGSSDVLNWEYLAKLKNLAERLKPEWISDHLCWTGMQNFNTHDLLPLPYTEEVIQYTVERIVQVQDFLNQRILIENVSCYISYSASEMTEWEFFSEIVQRSDCLILLDINNIYVNSYNHGFNPDDYLSNIPKARVQQIHLAGPESKVSHLIDTHNQPVPDPVWELYKKAISHFGTISTMIERDDNIPSFEELALELEIAKDIARRS